MRLFQESQQWKNKNPQNIMEKKTKQKVSKTGLLITERHEFHIEKIDLKPQNKENKN